MILTNIKSLLTWIEALGIFSVVSWRPYNISSSTKFPVFLVEDVTAEKNPQGGVRYDNNIFADGFIIQKASVSDNDFIDTVNTTLQTIYNKYESDDLGGSFRIERDDIAQIHINGVDCLMYHFRFKLYAPEIIG
jgi:hypothetical protein